MTAVDTLDTRRSPFAWGFGLVATVMALGNISLGIVLLAAPERVRGVSFAYVLHWAPPWVWGAAFLAAGLVALLGQHTHRLWPARVAHLTSAGMCAYWTLAFAVGGFHVATASITGCVAYGVLAAVHLVVAAVAPHLK